MRSHWLAFGLLPLLLAAPAAARDDPEWTACDFGIDPKAGFLATKRLLGNGKERGNFALIYGGRRSYGGEGTPAMPGIAACAKALASPDMTPKQ